MMINLNKVWNDNPFDQWTEEELLCMEGQAVCYGKGSSSPPPAPTVTTQTQVSEFPTELRPFISDIFEKSQAVQEQRQAEGFQPELTQQLAPFTGDQETAFEGIRQQVGQTRPLFEEATELARSSARGATDPAELAALMNPFLRNVVDVEKREAERVADVQEQQLAARAAQAGAFGGSRAGIIEAERQRNLATQLGDIESRGLALAFQDAQNRLQNQFGREASAAGQLSALGTAIPAQTFKELGALSGVGAAEQQQGQRALDIATQQAREEFGFPQQTLQDFSSILRGFPLPATTNVSKSTFSPAQPLSTQLIGLGAGLAGLAGNAGAFKKAGGRVGAPAPVGLKNGGYIKLAGGGGLGEMMQENLPSNRVRMGKVAYQDASGVPASPVAPVASGTLFEMTQEILDILEKKGEAGLIEIQSKYPREAINFALAQADSSQTSPAVTGTPADTATAAITKASTTVPSPSSGARTKPLGVIERMMGSLDEAVTGSDRGGSASSATAPLDSKMGVKVPEEQAQTVTTGLPPAQPQLLSGDPTASPEQTMKERAQQFLQTPILTSLGGKSADYTGTGDGGVAAMIAPSLKSFKEGLITYPPELLSIKDPKERFRKMSEHRDAINASRGQQVSRGGATVPTPETRPYDRNPPNPFGGVIAAAKGVKEALTPADLLSTSESSFISEGYDPNIDKALTKTPIAAAEEAVAKEAVTTSGPAGTKAEVAAVTEGPDGGVAAEVSFLDEVDPAARPTAPANVTQDKADYDKQIADIKSRDYADDIKAILGDAPTYEKGEEPDFAARKWLALATFSAGLLASGGGKTLAQSVGEAFKPALKELADIGKEERKIKSELRKERNAQKRLDYQDNLKRFDLQRKLRSDDINAIKMVADISQKEEQLKISRKNAESARSTAIANAGLQRLKTDTLIFDNFMKQKGFRTLDEVRKELDSYKQSFIKSQLAIAKASAMPYSADKIISEANKMFAAEAPNLINRAVGNTMRTDDKGKVLPYTREELVQRLAPLGATKPAGNRTATIQGLTVPPDSEGNPVGTKD